MQKARPYIIVNQDILIEYPHGAGGAFLSAVLACCTRGHEWQYGQVNFHKHRFRVLSNHWYPTADNVLSLDQPNARYNFWIYYFVKRIIHELERYRYQGRRWAHCPYQNLSAREDGFWILNQCRDIISYKTEQSWKISWAQMLQESDRTWNIICDFLESHNQPNHWNLAHWIKAVDNYRQTIDNKKVRINTGHTGWHIWATALLQEQGITPEFDLIDNFRKPVFLQWLEKHNQDLIAYTEKCIWSPVDQ